MGRQGQETEPSSILSGAGMNKGKKQQQSGPEGTRLRQPRNQRRGGMWGFFKHCGWWDFVLHFRHEKKIQKWLERHCSHRKVLSKLKPQLLWVPRRTTALPKASMCRAGLWRSIGSTVQDVAALTKVALRWTRWKGAACFIISFSSSSTPRWWLKQCSSLRALRRQKVKGSNENERWWWQNSLERFLRVRSKIAH